MLRPCAAPDLGAQRRRLGVPSCGTQGTLRGRRGTESGRSRGLGESQGKTFGMWDVPLPRPCLLPPPYPLLFFDYSWSHGPLPGVLTPGPVSCYPAFPALPWSSARPRELNHLEARLAGGLSRGRVRGPGAPGKGEPDQTVPPSALEWKPLSLSLSPPSHPFPGGQIRAAAPAHARLKKPRAEPPLRPEQV